MGLIIYKDFFYIRGLGFMYIRLVFNIYGFLSFFWGGGIYDYWLENCYVLIFFKY